MDLDVYLIATPTVESQHPEVMAFSARHTRGMMNPVKQAVGLYYAVRDEIRYDPYTFVLTIDGLRASHTLRAGRAWCVPKAILLAACCRSVGIPARLGYADVLNHLSTARMRQMMRSEIFYWHGYTSMYLDEQWVKATPAFNLELCRKFNLLPLEFDGRSNSLFHPFDAVGNRHMEYVRNRGEYADTPLDSMVATFRELFPELTGEGGKEIGHGADFDADVEAETQAIWHGEEKA
jgi:transglutaminase-like putative cysteine protease